MNSKENDERGGDNDLGTKPSFAEIEDSAYA